MFHPTANLRRMGYPFVSTRSGRRQPSRSMPLLSLIHISSNDIIAKDGDYTSIVADKIDGADFSDTALNDAFFEKVSYKGAFDGKNDWATNWTNFDPNNTEY